MTQITWTDPTNERRFHQDVVRYIEKYARSEEPDAKFVVHVNRLFNPADQLDWSMVVTSQRGRKHVNIEQRQPMGSIRFSYD